MLNRELAILTWGIPMAARHPLERSLSASLAAAIKATTADDHARIYRTPSALTDAGREQLDAAAARIIVGELTEPASLRTRVGRAVALLRRGVDPEHVLAVLLGEEPW